MELAYAIVSECWNMTVEIAPYLLLGFTIAGMLSAFITPATVEKHLGGNGLWPVTKASLLGVPLPLCSCGVIPVATSLRKHGAGKGATVSFLLSTPQTGVDSILATYGLLGPVFALLRPLAAFVSGILGGLATDWIDPDPAGGTAPQSKREEDRCDEEARDRNRLTKAMRHGFVVLPRDVALPMLAGLAIAGVLSALVPEDFFAGRLGTGFLSMVIMLAVSMPVYVCAMASAPIAAALMLKGLSPGAALVFMIAGPATSAATMAIVWKTLGRRAVLAYLAAVTATALAFGTLTNALVETVVPIATATHVHEHSAAEASLFSRACAFALLALLAIALVGKFRRRAE